MNQQITLLAAFAAGFLSFVSPCVLPLIPGYISFVSGISVEEMPDDETLDDLGIESAWDLTGMYRGVPLTQRSLADIAPQPDLIFLYRQPILLEWVETGEDLFRLVRNVLVHEIAHHFGFSDADIEALERKME